MVSTKIVADINIMHTSLIISSSIKARTKNYQVDIFLQDIAIDMNLKKNLVIRWTSLPSLKMQIVGEMD